MATATILSTSLILIPPKNSFFPSNSSPSIRGNYILRAQLGRRNFQKSPQLWRVSAAVEDALPSVTPVEKAQQIVSTADDGNGGSTIVSALLFTAFIGLCLLTIGVIYLAVQDFLQKRERDKFEKEETEKKKKGGKKVKVKARTGPRGFGQKIDEDDN